MTYLKRVFLAFGLLVAIGATQAKAADPEALSVCLATEAAGQKCGQSGINWVYGIYATGVASDTYVVLRDTDTANVTSSTKVIVYANKNGENTGTANSTIEYWFPKPIIFVNGISANPSTDATAATDQYYILYRGRR